MRRDRRGPARARAARTTASRSSPRCGPATRPSPGRTRRSDPTSRWCSPTAARCRSCRPTRSWRGGAEPRGHHRWTGIFLAAGPGIRRGRALDELSIVDVAPLLLHRLGLPVPDDMAGRVPGEILEPRELERRPPRHAAAGAGRGAGPGRPGRAGAGPRGAGGRHGAPARPRLRRMTREEHDAQGRPPQRDPDPLPAGRRGARRRDGPRDHRQPRGLAPAHRAGARRTASGSSPTTCAATATATRPPTGYSPDDMAGDLLELLDAPRDRAAGRSSATATAPTSRCTSPPTIPSGCSEVIAIEAALPALEPVRARRRWVGLGVLGRRRSRAPGHAVPPERRTDLRYLMRATTRHAQASGDR